jgi:chromosome partitioning protein
MKWINDYFDINVKIGQVILDLTDVVVNNIASSHVPGDNFGSSHHESAMGKLWVGFSSSKKEAIHELEIGAPGAGDKRQFLRNFMLLREQLVSDCDADFVIIDTIPGIRQWSVNALAVADVLLLTLKMGGSI